jgi:hypothetical protein
MLKPLLALLLLGSPLTARAVQDLDAAPAAPEAEALPEASTEAAHGSGDAVTTPSSDPEPVTPQNPLTIAPQGGISDGPKTPAIRPAAAAAAVAQAVGGGTSPSAHEPPTHNCIMPNRQRTVEAVLARPGMADALKRLCRHQTDWTFLDATIDELRKTDRRWGYWCRRGNCGDPSHDILAYYCGSGAAPEGTDDATGVDFVVASCYDPGDGANPHIGWGAFDKGNPVGSPGWTGRGRLRP